MVKNVVSLFFMDRQVRGNVFEYWFFAKVITNHCGNVSVNCLVVCDAGADGVCNRDITDAPGIEDAGATQHRRRIKRKRIQKVVIDATIDDINVLKSFRGSGVDLVVMHYQVTTFYYLDTHLTGKKSMFEVS